LKKFSYVQALDAPFNQAECVLKIDVMMGGYSKHDGMYV
jgi:hypothetical protein